MSIVRWNKHLDKIATCDASGTVIVWRNHNGRSIMELVNNRGTAISDFQWSNDGNKVLIAYIDGYVLVGTAYGRRIWARQLNLGSFVTNPNSTSQASSLLSSTWSPDDSRIVVGSSIGELIELDAITGGTLVSTTEVLPGIGIIGLQWVLVPKTAATNVDAPGTTSAKESHSSSLARGQMPASPSVNQQQGQQAGGGGDAGKSSNNVRLSLYLKNGKVVLMNSCGDQQATIIRTGLVDGRMLWSSDGAILAVAGFRKSQSMSTVRFFQPSGQLLFTLPLRTKVYYSLSVYLLCLPPPTYISLLVLSVYGRIVQELKKGNWQQMLCLESYLTPKSFTRHPCISKCYRGGGHFFVNKHLYKGHRQM